MDAPKAFCLQAFSVARSSAVTCMWREEGEEEEGEEGEEEGEEGKEEGEEGEEEEVHTVVAT